MFGQQGNTGFSGFNTTTQSSPFGQSPFGKPSTTTFGTTATPFGNTNQSLFSAKPAGTATGLFGSTAGTSAFGQPATTQSSFSAFGSTGANTSLFGTQQNANTSLFGTSSNTTSAFGQANKPTGFGGFGSPAGTGSLFGQPQQAVPQTTPFGQTNTTGNTNLFGTSSAGFRGATSGTGLVKFEPVAGSDTMVKNGVAQSISTKHHCIMAMKEYENKSLEELRLEDYQNGLKGPRQQAGQQTPSLFGTPQASAFGNTGTIASTVSSGFGAMTSGFGVNNQTNTPSSLFGKSMTGFGAPTTTTSTFAFNPTTSSGLFGANTQAKPFGTAAPTSTLFSNTNTNQQSTSGFGALNTTQTTGFGGFGTPQQNQSIGLFNQKPSAFSMTPATSNTGFGTAATPASTNSSLFGPKPLSTGFGSGTPFGATSAPAFGTTSGFGTTQNTQNTTNLFNTSFKPGGQNSSFPFGTTSATTGLGTNTGLGLNTGSGSLFNQQKPGLFGTPANTGFNFNSSGPFGPTGGFGVATTNTNTGLGTSFLNNGIGANPTQQNLSVPVHQQILALVSTPFGDSPLLKNLLPASGKPEELLKPTASSSTKTLNGSQFKVATTSSPKVKARVITPVQLSKKSLFEGLEEEDPTLLEAFQPRPNAKRLVLRPKQRVRSPISTIKSPENSENAKQKNDVEESIEASSSCSNNEIIDKDVINKENFQQRNGSDDRRSSSASWLRRQKNQEFDGAKSPFNTSEVPEEIDNTVAEFRNLTNQNTKARLNKNPFPREQLANKSASDSLLLTSNDSIHDDILDESSIPATLPPEGEPNLAKVTLRRSGYYTIPPIDQLDKYVKGETCIVPNFTVGRKDYGNVYFPDSFDIYGLNLDEIVHFRLKEVIIYPDDEKKPPVGQGLNRKAQVTLDRVWPHDKNLHESITDPERLFAMNYEGKLRRVSAKHDTRFLEYRPETGSWVFKVDHFSKYGLSDSDDEDDVPPNQRKDLQKMPLDWQRKKMIPGQLNQKQQIPQQPGGEQKFDNQVNELFSEQTGEGKVNGTEKQFFSEDSNNDINLNTTAENQRDLNGDKSSALSPTSIYARLVGTDSHKLQLMKASFFDENQDNEEMFMSEPVLAYEEDVVPMKRLHTFDVHDSLDLDKGGRSSFYGATNLLGNTPHYGGSDLLISTKEVSALHEIKKESKHKGHKIKQVQTGETINKYVPPPVIKPVTRVLKYHCEVIPLQKSICNKLKFHTIADISIQMGRKFKPSWGPGLTLVSLSTQDQASIVPLQNKFDQIETYIAGRFLDDTTSTNIVQRLQILGGNRADCDYILRVFKESIEDHLRIQLNHCVIGEENGCRWIRNGSGTAGLAALHNHASLAQDAADHVNSDRLASYTADVWHLCVALWGNLQDLSTESSKESGHDHVMIRREAFSDWLKLVVDDTVKHEIANINEDDKYILSLLSANKLEEACERARKIGDYTLAILIAQMGGVAATKELLKQTIALWQATDVLSNISLARLKIYMLIAGEQLIMYNNDVINVCENLDWKRALALHLWYLSVPTASITDVIELYEGAFDIGPSSDTYVYAAMPLPDYKDEEFDAEIVDDTVKKTYDLCFHLMKLYSTGNHSLDELLNPLTHTADPLDYRLSWLLQQVIVGLGYSHLSEHVATLTHTNFAAQLEAHDLWHWAIFVVLHVNNTTIRKTAVVDLLSRHVKIADDEDQDYIKRETFLKDDLGIPIKWIYEAKAIKGCASKRYGEAAWYLVQAEQWNKAHEVIIEHLSADAIINENYDYLRTLLSPFVTGPEASSVVNGWSCQGQLLWDYMEIAVEIESFLKNPDYSKIGYKLELLQPQLSSLCAKINQFPCPTAKLRLCQAEIAKRTLHLARSLLLLQPHDAEVSTAKILVRLVSQLPLPEDYAQQELRPIVNMCANEIHVGR